VIPNPRLELAFVVEPGTNLPAIELVAFIEAIDGLSDAISKGYLNVQERGEETYVESAHDGFKLDVDDAVLVGFVDLDLLDGTELW
jgi:hypothetical protein